MSFKKISKNLRNIIRLFFICFFSVFFINSVYTWHFMILHPHTHLFCLISQKRKSILKTVLFLLTRRGQLFQLRKVKKTFSIQSFSSATYTNIAEAIGVFWWLILHIFFIFVCFYLSRFKLCTWSSGPCWAVCGSIYRWSLAHRFSWTHTEWNWIFPATGCSDFLSYQKKLIMIFNQLLLNYNWSCVAALLQPASCNTLAASSLDVLTQWHCNPWYKWH